ncbi:hypothetical protein [Glaciibacter sp. 2TAF33]|uniref:hypothetical protein n=1 Tax=Glaciibacter sp. 2TAF33 TaxID=3233015 RepID=UPI003F91E420
MRVFVGLALPLLIAVALTGCAGQAEEPLPAGRSPVVSSTDEPVTPTPTASADPTPDATSASSADPALYSQFTQSAETGVDFRTPSGNIGCGIYKYSSDAEVFWGCALKEFDFPLPQRGDANDPCPAEVHYTGGIESIGQAKPKPSCRNDAPFIGAFDGEVRVLPYGESLSLTGVTCTSRESGVTCVADSGR